MDYRPEVAEKALALVAAYLPIVVTETSGGFEDWTIAGPVFVARAAKSLESIFALAPPDHVAAAEDLTRSLLDQIITFAWIAGDPVERTASWASDLHRQRLKLHNRVAGMAQSLRYRSVANSSFPGGVLNAQGLKIAQVAKDDGRVYPDLFQRAMAADSYWQGRIPVLKEHPFALLYCTVFSHYSFTSHPSVQGGLRFTRSVNGQVEVGLNFLDPHDDGPWGVALVLFLLMLLVSEQVLGWPSPADAIYAVMAES